MIPLRVCFFRNFNDQLHGSIAFFLDRFTVLWNHRCPSRIDQGSGLRFLIAGPESAIGLELLLDVRLDRYMVSNGG